MSIILKGIDLPKDGEGNGCRFLIVDCFGNVIDDVTEQIVAEAIQIPKGHGRIIDEDEIIMCGADWKKYRGMFDEIPTILEAEE